MALSDVTFIRGEGGLGRPLPGEDYISGLLAYMANGDLPSGFTTTDRVKQVFSLAQAESLGIVNDWADETKAATGGTVLINTAAAVGTTISVTISQPAKLKALANVTLGSYTVATGDTTTTIAAGLVTSINNRTGIHGYSASSLTATLTIVPPTGFGAIPNGQTIAYSDSTNATVTQLSAGAGSYLSALWYHIQQYFEKQPQGNLWIGLYEAGSFTGDGIKEMQVKANGAIRQLGIWLDDTALASSLVVAAQGKATELEAEHMPLSIVIGADVWSTTASALSDFSALASKNVSVTVGQDGDNYGNFLSNALGYSVTDLGAVLGTISRAAVNESIAWVQRFNIATNVLAVANDDFTIVDGIENNTPGFATGEQFGDQANSALVALDNKHYIFQRSHTGLIGTYFQSSWTCTAATSDYATIENMRTIDKASRLGRVFLLPKLNSPLFVQANGTLDDVTIEDFANDVNRALEQMETAREVSAFGVTIDPTQNVLTTSTIAITLRIIPVGVAKFIEVNVSYALSL